MRRATFARRIGPVPRGLLAAAALLAFAAPAPARAQSKEWYDLYDEAKKVIENEKAPESEIEAARRKLQTAIRAKDAEGNVETYNPSVRIDYLPHFYSGWASLRLKRYDEAEKSFKRSEDLGFIKKGAPAALKARFENFRPLVAQLKPAAEAIRSARGNPIVGQCVSSGGSAAGARIKDTISKIEAMLANPSDASALKGLLDGLNAATGECVKEVKGAEIAKLSTDYQQARDAVAVEGIADLVTPETRRELEAAVSAGKDAESRGDDEGLKAATRKLRDLPAKAGREVDARLAALAQEADRIAKGNQRALDEKNGLGTRLASAAADAARVKASGKNGLPEAVKAGTDLKALIETARGTMAPVLQAKGAALDAGKRDFESWSGQRACEIGAVGAREQVAAALRDAGTARAGESADAMDQATSRFAAVKSDVETKMKDALPRAQEAAAGVMQAAADIINNLPDPSKKSRGEGLRGEIEQAVARKDVCAIETAIASMNKWVDAEAPVLKRNREQAIARNRPVLEEGQRLLGGFGGILKAETVAALKAPVDRLAGLVKSSYDAAAMDASGQEVRTATGRARGEVQAQMQEGIRSLRSLRSDPAWKDVAAGRRQWLEGNLEAAERAVSEMSNPDLLARFALEYPRARLEMALGKAFAALYEQGDAAAAVRTLEDLGPGLRGGSAALNYALAYMYWWQGKGAQASDQEALLARAREAWAAGRTLRADAGLGAPLFAPAFVEEMSRQ